MPDDANDDDHDDCDGYTDRFLATEALMSSTRLQRSTFAVLAVIGQQLLDIGHPSESVRVLEAALRVPHAGADHQRVHACVLSTLAAACWALDRFQASIVYSLRALAVANSQSIPSSSSSSPSCLFITDILRFLVDIRYRRSMDITF